MSLNRLMCPRCQELMSSNRTRYAISRRDNKTKICSRCGTREALEDSGLVEPWFTQYIASCGLVHRPYWDANSPVWQAQLEKQHDEETGIDKLKAEAEADLPMMLRNQAE